MTTERTEPRDPRCWYCDDRGCSECCPPDFQAEFDNDEEGEMDSTVDWVVEDQIPEGLVRVHGPCHWCGEVYTRDLEPEYVKSSLAYGICPPCIAKDEAEKRMVI